MVVASGVGEAEGKEATKVSGDFWWGRENGDFEAGEVFHGYVVEPAPFDRVESFW
jgi:hypothetical protein